MQQATIEQMITKKQKQLIIVGKECIVDVVDGKDKYPEVVKKLWSYYNRGIK